MKASKPAESLIEVSPSQKKLKQARLPFKAISDGPLTPESLVSRKRKLSTQDNDVAVKIGKISDENVILNDSIEISDDDSKDANEQKSGAKISNAYVKLVDVAIKKKLKKSKTPKKKRNSKSQIESVDEIVDKISTSDSLQPNGDNEPMDVDGFTSDTAKENGDCNTERHSDKPNSISDLSQSDADNKNEASSAEESINENKLQTTDNICITDTIKEINTETSETKMESDNTNENVHPKSESKEEEISDIKPITPKRSARNKKKVEEKETSILDDSTTSSKLDESMSSNPSTPKHNRSANKQGDESLNDSKLLTPKQMQKRLESAKKREEREKEKQEKEKKRQQEKEDREKQKREKEEQKKKEREEKEEAKKKEKEEKEEQKRKEREEKEKQREMEKKLKEEKEEQKRKEKEEKEEQKRKEREAREEERRKKQEALELEKQEQELKKKKAAEAFVSFFVTKQKTEKDQAVLGLMSKSDVLSSFAIKSDMRLAPLVRSRFSNERKNVLEESLKTQNVSKNNMYLKRLKSGAVAPESSGKTWPLDDKDDECMIIEDDMPPPESLDQVISCETTIREKLRPKLLSFHENRRPPYWGTWRKKSAVVKPRKPFGQDEKLLDYEVDSDDEWEEEQEGESLDGSAAGSDTEPMDNDEYEVDNEVFVPHGYLSDEEATMGEDEILALSPEAQQARLKHLEDEFESELKKPTEKLKPRIYGLIWETNDGEKPEKCSDVLWKYFGKLSVIVGDPAPVLQPPKEPEEIEKKKNKKKKSNPEGEQASPKSEKKKKVKPEKKETKNAKPDVKKNTPEVKKNQLGINSFLTKVKTT